MTYRVICTYHPDVGTFRGNRGAWRVYACFPAKAGLHVPAVRTLKFGDVHGPVKLLCINSLKPRPAKTWCNPRKILVEWQKAMRG